MKTSEMVEALCREMNVSKSEVSRRINQSPQNFNQKLKRESLSTEELSQLAECLGVTYNQMFIFKDGTAISMNEACSPSKIIPDDPESIVLNTLVKEYISLYLVDLVQDRMWCYKISDELRRAVGESEGNSLTYSTAFNWFANGSVYRDDQPLFRRFASPEAIRETLSTKKSFSFVFREDKGGILYYYQISFMRVDDQNFDGRFVQSLCFVGEESSLADIFKKPEAILPVSTEVTTNSMDNRGKTILVVEDNELNREIAVDLLQDMGYKTLEAYDGLAAVDTMKSTKPGSVFCILMDIRMPRMDGYEATKAIRALSNERNASTPIIAMTANTLSEDRQKALESGMNDFISKPIDSGALAAMLDSLK